jgi:HD superfamily phosphohydrolase
MNNISCPLCKHRGKKLIEIKYIGMINAKWVYRGYLTGLKYSNVEGQGITILNDVIYRTKQILFSQQFLALNIQIEKYFSNNTIIKEEKQKKFSTINTTYYTDNSNYSIVSEENEQKVSIINDDSKYSELSKVMPIKLMKNRIKKRKVKNRNQLRNFYSKNVINTANCEFNDYVFTKNTTSCWDNCVKCDKKNNDCLIF